jgi:bifunctional UDP-N-acetylglucosamine pyrophosphorylase/glucosamine-1-phosphate N-acetyltransferase
MKQWAAIVMAAGKGTRMRSKRPKVLHALCGWPMVAHVAEAIRQAEVRPIVAIVGPGEAEVRAALGKGVRYARQREPRGTADAVAKAGPLLEGHAARILVVNGDTPLLRPETLRELMAQHERTGAAATFLSCNVPDPDGLGRVVRDGSGAIVGVLEDAELAPAQREIAEINAGAYCFDAAWLWPALGELRPVPRGELYLTSLIGLARGTGRGAGAVRIGDWQEALGVDTRVRLAEAEAVMRQRIRRRWMLAGVTMTDPASVYIDAGATIGPDTVLRPHTSILGASVVGQDCEIGPGTVLSNARIGKGCRVLASVVEDSSLEPDVTLGPYSHIRGNSVVASGSRLGNFVEVNRSKLGARTRSHHFSYLGDATLGADVNIGAGSITCNYDGVRKLPTVIEDGVFVGCDTMLVAPVRMGRKSKSGAGAVVTRDVPPRTTVVGVPARPLAKAAPARPSSGRIRRAAGKAKRASPRPREG